MRLEKKRTSIFGSLMPLAIISGLLHAGLFVKPSVNGNPVRPPLFDRHDRFYGLAIVQDRMVWASGSEGKIVHTEKGPSEWAWAAQNSGVEANLQAIDAWDRDRLVAVGNDGVIVVTSNGGSNWATATAPRSSIANKLVRVRAEPEGHAYAVGEYNAILKSTDFGRTWARVTPEKDIAWYALDLSGTSVLVAGEFGRVLISSDEGKSWRAVQTPTKAHLTGAAFKSASEVVLVGLNGTILHSADAGTTWQIIPTGIDEHIYDVIWDGTRYIACGDRGLLITSSDGTHWTALETGLGVERNFLWFTQIRKFNSGYMMAGSTLALVRENRFLDLSKSASISPLPNTSVN